MKANVKSRVHRRVYLDYIGVKRFDGDGNAVGEFRILGLFTSTAYTRSMRIDPVPAPQGRRRAASAPASIRTPIPARRWSTCWRAIRATSCSRSTRTRSTNSPWRSCSSTSGRACACWRGATGSTASCRCWSTCRASATIQRGARADRRVSRRGLQGPRQRVLSVLPGRRRSPACISSSADAAAKRPIPTAPTLEQAVGAIVRTWSDALGARLAEAHEPGRARGAVRALRQRVLRGLSRGLFAGRCGRRHPRHRGAVGGAPARRRVLSRAPRTASPASA